MCPYQSKAPVDVEVALTVAVADSLVVVVAGLDSNVAPLVPYVTIKGVVVEGVFRDGDDNRAIKAGEPCIDLSAKLVTKSYFQGLLSNEVEFNPRNADNFKIFGFDFSHI